MPLGERAPGESITPPDVDPAWTQQFSCLWKNRGSTVTPHPHLCMLGSYFIYRTVWLQNAAVILLWTGSVRRAGVSQTGIITSETSFHCPAADIYYIFTKTHFVSWTLLHVVPSVLFHVSCLSPYYCQIKENVQTEIKMTSWAVTVCASGDLL